MERPGALGENVHVDARRAGARFVTRRRTIDSGGSARSCDIGAFLKSSVERPRQKADASVANPARSFSSRLRKTASRMESSTADCGMTGAGRAADGEGAFGAVAL